MNSRKLASRYTALQDSITVHLYLIIMFEERRLVNVTKLPDKNSCEIQHLAPSWMNNDAPITSTPRQDNIK